MTRTDDGDGTVRTPEIAVFLEGHGCRVHAAKWGRHNVMIHSIIKDGIEIMPHCHPRFLVGYHHPECYLPEDIVTLLELAQPLFRDEH